MEETDGLPKVQGIQLIGTHQLPDRIRPIFPFPVFNAIQSKCFNTIFRTDDNFVLSSPTGSGKTAILELAICRLVATQSSKDFKIVYQAPTKSLCAERSRDWHTKFSHVGLKCAELTGDTEQSQLKGVREADILVTTPEKWDSMTRKWKDHRKLLEMVKLFLIDEVHILKEDRGASLEAVVSRMKTVGSGVRFVALSATVPNSEDIATWLGRSNRVPGMPAAREVFGEEFRPVKLQKFVFGLHGQGQNDFSFDKSCTSRLPDIISEHSAGKPIMVFCMTRKLSEQTAEALASWWMQSAPSGRCWQAPRSVAGFNFKDPGLRACATAGVAFHHAGLSITDRTTIEKSYLNGDLNVICCTSTLAAGVNLPCHFVIIKNTVCWQDGCKEYSDLDVMQMLGRAGRPQFDRSAVAVVMTRQEKVERYEKMVSGLQILESRLHVNLIEHLNAEVVLGTVKDSKSAATWLQGTFLFTRFRKNPAYYRLEGSPDDSTAEQVVDSICKKGIDQLREFLLISDSTKFKATEFGDAMAKYCVRFETMKMIMCLQAKARISEIISALAQATELKGLRFRASEKAIFQDINSSPSIKYPIPVDLALAPHKISLLIQAMLGGLDLQHDEHFGKEKQQLLADSSVIFQHVPRLIRCIIDCAVHRNDSITARNALELSRSLGARVWDDSPLQMMQVEKIGPVAARKLIGANIMTIEDLEWTEPHKIEMTLSRNPPFGTQILAALKSFPKLRVSLKRISQPKLKTTGEIPHLSVDVKAEIGFLNEQPPTQWKKSTVQIVLLAETSDGRVAHYCRFSAQKIGSGENIMFAAPLTAWKQTITCYVACDDIAGTMKSATLDPKVPEADFRQLDSIAPQRPNSSRSMVPKHGRNAEEEFDDSDLDDRDLVKAADADDFDDIEEVLDDMEIPTTPPRTQVNTGKKRKAANEPIMSIREPREPKKLPNCKWECLHHCADKTSCKHLCCREGMDNKPRPSKKKKDQMQAVSKEGMTELQVNDYFGQSKKAAPTKSQQSMKQSRLTLSSDDHFPRKRSTAKTPDVASHLPSSRRALPFLDKEPSSHGIFLTSSPDKRPVEQLDLSGEKPKTASKKQPARKVPDLNVLADGFQDDFDDFDEDDFATPQPRSAVKDRGLDLHLPTSPGEDELNELAETASLSSLMEYDTHVKDLIGVQNAARTQQPPAAFVTARSLSELENLNHRPSPFLAGRPQDRGMVSRPDFWIHDDDDENGAYSSTRAASHPTTGQKESRHDKPVGGAGLEGNEPAALPTAAAAKSPVDDTEKWFRDMFGDCADIV